VENSLKQRLVGAIVLIALAVIFLPAVLKEKAQKTPFVSQIPPKPIGLMAQDLSDESKQKIRQTEAELDKLQQQKQAQSDESADEEQTTEVAQIESGKMAEGNDTSKAEKTTDNTEKTAETPSVAKTETKKAAVPTKQTINAQFKDAAWVIQVASFSSEDNAAKLVEKLQKAGHKSFRHEVKTRSGKRLYRIYAGPYIEKSSAEKALKAVDKVAETHGMLVVFDPQHQ